MKENFRIVPFNSHLDIPNFRISRLSSCYESYFNDFNEEWKLPITESTNAVFDDGNVAHLERELYSKGARGVIARELEIKAIHSSGKFTISGHIDLLQIDFRGLYIRDYKSTKRELHNPNKKLWLNERINAKDGFAWHLVDGISKDNKIQLSGYAFLYYILTGVYITEGVIEKIDKNNHRNTFGQSGALFTLPETRGIILNHPVIHAVLGRFGRKEVARETLREYAIVQMRDDVRADGKCWKCENATTICQYTANGHTCPVRDYIEKDRAEVKGVA